MAHFLKINWASGSVCINHHVAAVWIPSTVYNDENKPKIGRESAIYFLKKTISQNTCQDIIQRNRICSAILKTDPKPVQLFFVFHKPCSVKLSMARFELWTLGFRNHCPFILYFIAPKQCDVIGWFLSTVWAIFKHIFGKMSTKLRCILSNFVPLGTMT